MLENSFVFDVVPVLFTSGAISSDKTRSGMFENRFYSGSDWVLSICGWDLMFFGSLLSVWVAMKYES